MSAASIAGLLLRLAVAICIVFAAIGYAAHGAEHDKPANAAIALLAALGAALLFARRPA